VQKQTWIGRILFKGKPMKKIFEVEYPDYCSYNASDIQEALQDATGWAVAFIVKEIIVEVGKSEYKENLMNAQEFKDWSDSYRKKSSYHMMCKVDKRMIDLLMSQRQKELNEEEKSFDRN
jgi:hypothetical protein